MITEMDQHRETEIPSQGGDVALGPGMTQDRYLVRFDDICPTMNWQVWEGIEAHLDRHGVKPILAVVPENVDPKLMVDEARSDFWARVRGWQAKGYTIAIHGYQHRYINKNPGIIGVTHQSEFAGLPRAEQEAKLRKGLAIFAAEGVRADAWVAPSHSFDHTTVQLLRELGVPVISDGLGTWPATEEGGLTWIPQQLWAFQKKPAGVWTVCFHHNNWTDRRLEAFGRDLATYGSRMTHVAAVARAFANRRPTGWDRTQALGRLLWGFRVRPLLAKAVRSVIGSRAAAE